ncbi:serine/threonine-protein kinase [Nocardia cyriacigeorgica]|uniref:non-specific serine/threonine protein kinase n=1 Tax=Nocardia cyriacigeorgica TaxID=135487 RepID=A0A5R8NJN0_9NOCA|nr:serine/threonine-protein kinase [Nocardia cyriacigeorgica]TLF75885.1 serine/threonine protein kinase [Nocardia cyriacigeorgica]
MLAPGDEFVGYTIRKVLGRGGMGTVYLAKHPRLPRLTALKLLNRELYTDNEIRRRFEREADLAAQLDHPNIVTVYDRGAEDRQLWISMQFVPGADASIADVNVLAPGRAVQIIAETAAALDFAHANRVLHRDVKPANILLAKAPIGQPERVLLTDFGIAGMRDSDTTLSSADTITATLAFAAPEQLTGAKLDHRGDQYSLACTLYWLLTGDSPYAAPSPAAVINGHLTAPVPRLSRVRPGLPPALDDVLARALAKDRADRFDSCTEFAAAARRALGSAGAPPPYTGWLPAHGAHLAAPQAHPGAHGHAAAPGRHHGHPGSPARHPAPPHHPAPPSRGVALHRHPHGRVPGPHYPGMPPHPAPPRHAAPPPGPPPSSPTGHPVAPPGPPPSSPTGQPVVPHSRGPASRPDHRFPSGPAHQHAPMPNGPYGGPGAVPPPHGGQHHSGDAPPPGTRPIPQPAQQSGPPPRRPPTPAVIDLPGAPRRTGRAPFGGSPAQPRRPPEPEQSA